MEKRRAFFPPPVVLQLRFSSLCRRVFQSTTFLSRMHEDVRLKEEHGRHAGTEIPAPQISVSGRVQDRDNHLPNRSFIRPLTRPHCEPCQSFAAVGPLPPSLRARSACHRQSCI